MLKALQLAGFKSFADKTRLEFPPGITVIVGPNGSGKSNIVDAIKWVLGEQSAKSLRGREMADVIFKGSSSSNRRPMNTAEATLIFDNNENRLPVDTPEVHITRRVYRSGEGDYLINGQPCRLRDIRDLFRGTGAGADTYSLIEQGKVDVLLAASPLERRAIFEEAAGISRFKAKKLEAERRLDRVDQNLLRLFDIIDEVDSRLRSIKSQASKARRYQEHTKRLQKLRIDLSLTDWQQMTAQLSQVEDEIRQIRSEVDKCGSEAESADSKLLEWEAELGRLNELLRTHESQLAANRELIAARESKIEHQRQRVTELAEQRDRHRVELKSVSTRADDLQSRLNDVSLQFNSAENHHESIQHKLVEYDSALDGLTSQLTALRLEGEQQRRRQVEALNSAATLGRQASASESEIAGANGVLERCERRLSELYPVCQLQREQVEQLRAAEQGHVQLVDDRTDALSTAQTKLTESRTRIAKLQEHLSDSQARHTAVTERAAVLQELEDKLEGLNAGVREVLQKSRTADGGPFGTIRGLVADLVQTGVTHAPLVDVALGEKTQYMVVEGDELFDHLQQQPYSFSGRVAFLRLDTPGPEPRAPMDLSRRAGVLGRADQFVTADPSVMAMVQCLLGHTWFVETLSDAIALHEAHRRSARFVTVTGELVEADGTVIVGPAHASSGLISRRSQLRALRQQAFQLEQELVNQKQVIQQLHHSIREQESLVSQLTEEHKQATATLTEHRIHRRAAKERLGHLDQQRTTIQSESATATTQRDSATGRLDGLRQQLVAIEAALDDYQIQIRDLEQQIQHVDVARQERYQQTTQAKVEFAKSEQKLQNLHLRMTQFQEDQKERDQAIQQTREQLSLCIRRGRESEHTILNTSAEIAGLYITKEDVTQQSANSLARREQIGQFRADIASQAHRLRQKMRRLQDQAHQRELSAGKVRHERSTMADRLREDYGIEIAQLADQPEQQDDRSRSEVEVEIADLRRKINNIGAVNMNALAELEELQSRHELLQGQYKDLNSAKDSLEKIIAQINIDSRQLFTETLDTVRANFQSLFRKVFGGGEADILLEEGQDVLECGIEIVAMPPGKHSLTLSLLSGGERALTAVTLLLAIFQYRPSPFCVLDEVDGPLDESNIERFIGVLNEFLNWTRFVIVTHSKKTMTAATTLYGVTMQESGISKRVSVQFDDVSDDDAIHREGGPVQDEPASDGNNDERPAA